MSKDRGYGDDDASKTFDESDRILMKVKCIRDTALYSVLLMATIEFARAQRQVFENKFMPYFGEHFQCH